MDIENLRDNIALRAFRRRRDNNAWTYFLRHTVFGNTVKVYEISTTDYERWDNGKK